MNIIYYLHQFPAIGGIEAVTATLSNYFVAHGDNVTIVSHIDGHQLGSGLELDARVKVLHTPDTRCYSHRNREFLQKTIRDQHIDIAVFQDSYAAIERNLIPIDGDARVISVEHSAPYFDSDFIAHYSLTHRILWHLRHPFWKVRRMAYERGRRRFLYDNSSRFVLLSNQFYGEFRAITGLKDTQKLRAIPNPIVVENKSPAAKKCNEILFCATLSDLKGCDLLLKVWHRIQSECSGWNLTIVGDGPDRPMLERLKADLKLERCSFEGYKTDPSPYFARAKIFAFPSRREGWGLVLVEAMANGCVPIAFDSYGAVHDIIDHEVSGLLVPAYDLESYSRAIINLIENDGELNRLSHIATLKSERFSKVRVMALWLTLFKEVENQR